MERKILNNNIMISCLHWDIASKMHVNWKNKFKFEGDENDIIKCSLVS